MSRTTGAALQNEHEQLIAQDPSYSQPESSSSAGGGQDSSIVEQKVTSRAILANALAKAQSAVQLDSTQKTSEALKEYNEAVKLLNQVLEKTDSAENRIKLKKIV